MSGNGALVAARSMPATAVGSLAEEGRLEGRKQGQVRGRARLFV